MTNRIGTWSHLIRDVTMPADVGTTSIAALIFKDATAAENTLGVTAELQPCTF